MHMCTQVCVCVCMSSRGGQELRGYGVTPCDRGAGGGPQVALEGWRSVDASYKITVNVPKAASHRASGQSPDAKRKRGSPAESWGPAGSRGPHSGLGGTRGVAMVIDRWLELKEKRHIPFCGTWKQMLTLAQGRSGAGGRDLGIVRMATDRSCELPEAGTLANAWQPQSLDT